MDLLSFISFQLDSNQQPDYFYLSLNTLGQYDK